MPGYVSAIDTVCPAVGLAGEIVPTVTGLVVFTVTVTSFDGAPVVVVPLVVDTPAVAVTFDVRFVVSTMLATPLPSVVPDEGFSDPKSVLNDTGTPGNALPEESKT